MLQLDTNPEIMKMAEKQIEEYLDSFNEQMHEVFSPYDSNSSIELMGALLSGIRVTGQDVGQSKANLDSKKTDNSADFDNYYNKTKTNSEVSIKKVEDYFMHRAEEVKLPDEAIKQMKLVIELCKINSFNLGYISYFTPFKIRRDPYIPGIIGGN